jgi:hypothetical protein
MPRRIPGGRRIPDFGGGESQIAGALAQPGGAAEMHAAVLLQLSCRMGARRTCPEAGGFSRRGAGRRAERTSAKRRADGREMAQNGDAIR